MIYIVGFLFTWWLYRREYKKQEKELYDEIYSKYDGDVERRRETTRQDRLKYRTYTSEDYLNAK